LAKRTQPGEKVGASQHSHRGIALPVRFPSASDLQSHKAATPPIDWWITQLEQLQPKSTDGERFTKPKSERDRSGRVATLDGVVVGAIFEAKFILPWSFSENAGENFATARFNLLTTSIHVVFLLHQVVHGLRSRRYWPVARGFSSASILMPYCASTAKADGETAIWIEPTNAKVTLRAHACVHFIIVLPFSLSYRGWEIELTRS
jgi:hypothetical protein